MMQIRVKSLQGDEYVVGIQSDQLVSELKVKISEKASGLPVERLKLIYKGRTLQDSSPVGEYNLEDNCKVHLIIRKETAPLGASKPEPSLSPMNSSSEDYSGVLTENSSTRETLATSPPLSSPSSSSSSSSPTSASQSSSSSSSSCTSNESQKKRQSNSSNDNNNNSNIQRQNRFEMILRERLGQHFSPQAVEQIMDNLQRELNDDMNSSSLDDLEQLAKQKLNISNE